MGTKSLKDFERNYPQPRAAVQTFQGWRCGAKNCKTLHTNLDRAERCPKRKRVLSEMGIRPV